MTKACASLLAVLSICSACSNGNPTPQSKSSHTAPQAPVTSTALDVVVPTGTSLHIALESAVSSDQSRPEDRVRGKLTKAVEIEGVTVIPVGSEVTGVVVDAQPSGRVKGRALVAFQFDKLNVHGETYAMNTSRIVHQAEATKRDDAVKIGVGSGAGALIGAVVGGGKGAAVGAGIGAGAGTGVVLATRGKEVHLGPGAVVKTTLEDALTIQRPVE